MITRCRLSLILSLMMPLQLMSAQKQKVAPLSHIKPQKQKTKNPYVEWLKSCSRLTQISGDIEQKYEQSSTHNVLPLTNETIFRCLNVLASNLNTISHQNTHIFKRLNSMEKIARNTSQHTCQALSSQLSQDAEQKQRYEATSSCLLETIESLKETHEAQKKILIDLINIQAAQEHQLQQVKQEIGLSENRLYNDLYRGFHGVHAQNNGIATKLNPISDIVAFLTRQGRWSVSIESLRDHITQQQHPTRGQLAAAIQLLTMLKQYGSPSICPLSSPEEYTSQEQLEKTLQEFKQLLNNKQKKQRRRKRTYHAKQQQSSDLREAHLTEAFGPTTEDTYNPYVANSTTPYLPNTTTQETTQDSLASRDFLISSNQNSSSSMSSSYMAYSRIEGAPFPSDTASIMKDPAVISVIPNEASALTSGSSVSTDMPQTQPVVIPDNTPSDNTEPIEKPSSRPVTPELLARSLFETRSSSPDTDAFSVATQPTQVTPPQSPRAELTGTDDNSPKTPVLSTRLYIPLVNLSAQNSEQPRRSSEQDLSDDSNDGVLVHPETDPENDPSSPAQLKSSRSHSWFSLT
jgi:hypothetical protein